jgi:hypothetical protein
MVRQLSAKVFRIEIKNYVMGFMGFMGDSNLMAALELGFIMDIYVENKVCSTKTLVTNKCTKRVLSSIVTHSYMFRPCWVIFRENFFVIVTIRLHFIVE